jgi:hypothetical protein
VTGTGEVVLLPLDEVDVLEIKQQVNPDAFRISWPRRHQIFMEVTTQTVYRGWVWLLPATLWAPSR